MVDINRDPDLADRRLLQTARCLHNSEASINPQLFQMGTAGFVTTVAGLLCLLYSSEAGTNSTSTGGSTCNFEGSLCDWTQSDNDNLQWSLQAGPTPTRLGSKILTGPSYDHTFGTARGFYVYLETLTVRSGQFADLLSKNVFSEDVELEFWYYLHGLSMGSLKVLMWSVGQPYPAMNDMPEWTVSRETGDNWNKAALTIQSNMTQYKIILRAEAGGRGTSDIAIDDVTLKVVNATVVTPSQTEIDGPASGQESVLFSCNFDFGSICAWQHPRFGVMKWLVRTDSSPTSRTGATRDHTSGRGRFAYIETSSRGGNNLTPGAMALITSPPITAEIGCPVVMTFYYNMFGQDIGQLQIQLKNLTPSNVWNLTGPQHTNGDTWTKARFQLPDVVEGKTFQLNIVAFRGDGPYGDICIDDLTITQDCGALPDNQTTSSEQMVDGTLMSSADVWFCDFEEPCEFEQSTNDQFDWSLNSGPTSTRYTGPNDDHTLGNRTGHYLFIETSKIAPGGISPSQIAGDMVTLRSPAFSPVSGCSYTLTFFYSMYGRSTGSLVVKMKGQHSSLWSRSGQQTPNGDTWRQASVTLPIKPGQAILQVEIEGVRGDSYLGDIAIDDISLNQNCANKTTTATTTTVASTASTTTSTKATTPSITTSTTTSSIKTASTSSLPTTKRLTTSTAANTAKPGASELVSTSSTVTAGTTSGRTAGTTFGLTAPPGGDLTSAPSGVSTRQQADETTQSSGTGPSGKISGLYSELCSP
ncbi:hypothetical protein RRG08_024888 [Elysia crispata]|uniref:MAM domain-containing protein n=1 Tax=Elysia crispata TaxID=231223 RepID=A0AAE1CZL5_9GAST|nr:hypothetical protein RRG08_024888 [Elysia crispata]